MALTITEIANPAAAQTFGSRDNYRTHTVRVTFDNSYPTTGEVITAAQLGFIQLRGVEGNPIAKNAAGTLAMPILATVNSTGTQMTLQLLRYDGAAAGKASLEEAANTFDASLFSAEITFKGVG